MAANDLQETVYRDYTVRSPLFPLYSHVRHCLKIWDGEAVKAGRDMISAIHEQTGTPQNPVDWSDPDQWIAERLNGENARLASAVWERSGKTVNPRHVYGCYLFINQVQLLEHEGGRYILRERGERFLASDISLVREIDKGEGIPRILSLVSEMPHAKRSDMIEDWGRYLESVSKFTSPKVFGDTLRRRLLNMVERGLVERDGNYYSVTEKGISYLRSFADAPGEPPSTSERTEITMAVRRFNEEQKAALRKKLEEMNPYAFEHFVKVLLEAMDYENVEVTKQSGDKGVDVVANFQFGITEITEVVQVKRVVSNIGRRTIDELRGALPYHGAIRGTIITLGGFARGVAESALYPGAAPITLIDGERLMELIVKHQIGIQKKSVELLEIEEGFFDKPPTAGNETDATIGEA